MHMTDSNVLPQLACSQCFSLEPMDETKEKPRLTEVHLVNDHSNKSDGGGSGWKTHLAVLVAT